MSTASRTSRTPATLSPARSCTRGPAVMFLGDSPYQTRLDLMQWVTPASPAHEPQDPTQIGIPRIVPEAKNIDVLYADLVGPRL